MRTECTCFMTNLPSSHRQRTTESRARTHIAHTSHNISRLNPSLCAATRGSEAAHLAAAAATARQTFIRGHPHHKGGPAGPCISRPPILGRANGKQAQARDCAVSGANASHASRRAECARWRHGSAVRRRDCTRELCARAESG